MDTMRTDTTDASSSPASSRFLVTEGIEGILQNSKNAHHNLPAQTLHQMALEHDNCSESSTGALIAFSGTLRTTTVTMNNYY